jgi:hypothetical protein
MRDKCAAWEGEVYRMREIGDQGPGIGNPKSEIENVSCTSSNPYGLWHPIPPDFMKCMTVRKVLEKIIIRSLGQMFQKHRIPSKKNHLITSGGIW